MDHCRCRESHEPRRIVVTGGPGAGKTAVLELMHHAFCRHVKVLPESAGIVFGGGFPRSDEPGALRAAQRAIFHVQTELEAAYQASHPCVLLCDRGTADGAAYWPGTDDFFAAVGTTRERELARYAAVVHLRPPTEGKGYNRENPLRVESAEEAHAIDHHIARVWGDHPRYRVVEATPEFLKKAARTLAVVRAELPACCAHRVEQILDTIAAK